MRRTGTRFLMAVLVAGAFAGAANPALAGGPGAGHFAATSPGAVMRFSPGPIGPSFYYPSFGFYGGYSPFAGLPSFSAPYPYMPKYWWTGPYASEDPRQDGYNPNAGYRWDKVMTLIVTTSPAKAEITLDGSDIGRAEDLGPLQLPAGTHTLRVEAPGFEPSETVIGVRAPSVQKLQITLKTLPAASAAVQPR